MFGLYMIMCLFYFLPPKLETQKHKEKHKEKQDNNIQEKWHPIKKTFF